MFLRNVLLVVGALCVLLGAGLLLTRREPPSTRPPPAVASHLEPAVSVLTAAHAVRKGSLLKQGDMIAKPLKSGEGSAPGSLAPGQESGFVGALARRNFAEGELLIASDFVKPSDRNFLAAVLRPGFRATSIFVDAAQSVAGLALPGDLVDVILVQTFGDSPDPSRRTAGETVLRGARVLALDQALGPPLGAGSEARVPKTVTLEVTEQQAKALPVAAKLGVFQLSLRPLDAPADGDISADPTDSGPVWASDISPALRQAARSRPQAPKAALPPARCPPLTGSSLDKSVRCAPSQRAAYQPPVAAAAEPEAAPGPAVRVAPARGGEGAAHE